MKLSRFRPLTLVLPVAAAAIAFGADTTPKKEAGAKAAGAKPGDAAPAEAAKPAANAGEVLAVVEGEEIKRGEVEGLIAETLKSRGMPPDALPPAEKDNAVRQVLDRVVIDRLLKKATAAVKISDADVDGEINKIKAAQNLTDKQVEEQIAAMGRTMAQVKEDIRTDLARRKWFEDKFADKVKPATDAETKEFYETNKAQFEQPETVRASHILFRLEPDAAPEKVTEVKKKAEAAMARAQKEDFAKLAGELSEEPGAKERGGDLDFFTKERMVPEFSKAAFAMKPGEVSKEPVRTQFGFHVIKLTDHKAASTRAFDEVKGDIGNFLTNRKKSQAANDIVADMRAKAKVDIKLAPAPEPAPAPAAPKAPKVEAVTPPVTVPAEAPKK